MYCGINCSHSRMRPLCTYSLICLQNCSSSLFCSFSIFSHTFPSSTYYRTVNNIIGGFKMSELSATNCGCGCESNFGGNSCIWIILLLLCCGGCGNGWSNGNGCGNDSCLWIILLLIFCGGCGNGFGNNGCGCSNNGCGC